MLHCFQSITTPQKLEMGKIFTQKSLSDTEIAEKIQISIEQLQTTIKTCKTKLTKVRSIELNQDSMTRF
jgi:predicted DNA-binding protein YlxM (UPF0122 family)